jgi:hypothetical protein
MGHNGIGAVAAKDPDLEQVPRGGRPDNHHKIVVACGCAVHLVTDCVEDVFAADAVLASDIRDPR